MNRLFLSWSGEPSRTVALGLKRWLPSVIHALDPWVSHEDIRPGDRWSGEVSKALAETEFGIVCVTEVNMASQWLNFEAGALAKTLEQGRVFPYLISMRPAALYGPLSQFQAVSADIKGTASLLRSLNRFIEKPLEADRLLASFDKWWPDLGQLLDHLPEPSRDLESSGADWPNVKTVASLTRTISKLSTTQRNILQAIVSSDHRLGGNRGDGLYPGMLEQTFSLGRAEIVYRCKDLRTLGLVDIVDRTDKCYRITDSVYAVLKNDPASFFNLPLKSQDKHGTPFRDRYDD